MYQKQVYYSFYLMHEFRAHVFCVGIDHGPCVIPPFSPFPPHLRVRHIPGAV